MKVSEVASVLKLVPVTTKGNMDAQVEGAYTSDLLSNVMGQAKPGMMWITMQGHHNIAAVASLLGLAAIVVTGASKIEDEAIAKADANGLVILTTPMSSYEAAGKLYALGVTNEKK